MKIIGRKKEIEALEACEKSKKSELVCVYGRRRVGKTFLVEQTFAGNMAFRATGVEGGSTRQQLKAFNQRLIERGDDIKTIPKDWFEAFSRLEKVLSFDNTVLSPNGKKIVFLDEFPWFATPRSDFLMAFGEFWNRCGTADSDYLFVICGSATSWIINNVLDNTGSLYHRVTCQIFLSPFTLRDSENYFRDRGFGWSRSQIMECQMVFGGLPYFLDLLNHNESLRQNVDRLLFRQNAMLQGEASRLLEATLKSSPVYEQILNELSKHRYGMLKSECQKTLNLPDGTFCRAIEDLAKCGYVITYKRRNEKYNPVYIQLTDPFLLFHYHFINQSSKSSKEMVSSYTELATNSCVFSNWRGHAFEVLCLSHIEQIKKALGITGVKTEFYPWTSKSKKNGAQIDLVIERDDRIINICEIKCTDKPFTISKDYEIKLLNKRDVFVEETGTRDAVRLILVSAEGIKGSAHTENIASVITLDDLFE